ncbi:MAG: amidohydrolase family protein [Arcanobacterium sp.]|nr:amidohydrolase family protein [Arcanobacterium sp.]
MTIYSASHAIDTHAHVYPARYLDFLESIGVSPDSTHIARNLRADSTETDMAARLAMMDTAGVQLQIISATPQLPFVDSSANAAAAVRMINDIYADIVATHPDRFCAYGSLPLPHVDESLAEISHIFDDLGREAGFLGVAMNTFIGADGPLTTPALAPVFEELDRRGAIVYIHPAGGAAGCAAVADHGLTWVNGAPMEDAIAVLQLLKGDYPHKFPHIRFHIAHLGGDLPFLSQRIQDNYDDWHAFAHSPAETFQRLFVDAANFHQPSLRMALETYGANHVMAGSDYPYFQDAKYTRAMDYIRTAHLPEEVCNAVLYGTAQHLYEL